MPWLNRHPRFLDRLSAYIDGQLDPAQAEALEAHLAGCPSCRRQLEELRATVLALRDLPQEQLPRSFALTPEQAARPVPLPPQPRPAALPTVMPRLAGAALAFTLAVILVIDLGDLTGDGGGQLPLAEPAAEMAAPPMEPAPAAGAPPDEEAAEEEISRLMDTQAAAPPPEAGAEREALGDGPTPTAARAPEEAAQPGGGGIDPLRAAEIALAATLGIFVVGSLTLAFARRKR